MDEENVLDFLTSLEAMDLPDRIEEVNARILSKIVEDTDYVAVLFCKCNQTSTEHFERHKDQHSTDLFSSKSVVLLRVFIICLPCKKTCEVSSTTVVLVKCDCFIY
jgi:hypothetical protein